MKILTIVFFLLICVFIGLMIMLFFNNGKIRRSVLSCFGLLKYKHNQGQRCFRCDLYDDERGACLIVINHPRMGLVNTRVKKMGKCIWSGKLASFVDVLDIDKEVASIKAELKDMETNGFPEENHGDDETIASNTNVE